MSYPSLHRRHRGPSAHRRDHHPWPHHTHPGHPPHRRHRKSRPHWGHSRPWHAAHTTRRSNHGAARPPERKRHRRIWRQFAGFKSLCGRVDQFLRLFFHPLLIIKSDAVFMFSAAVMGFSYRRRIVCQKCVAIIAIIFRHDSSRSSCFSI